MPWPVMSKSRESPSLVLNDFRAGLFSSQEFAQIPEKNNGQDSGFISKRCQFSTDIGRIGIKLINLCI